MDRQEAMQHFLKTYALDEYLASLKALDDYYQSQNTRLIADFAASFLELCTKIIKAQKQGRKGKIAYIYCSFLYTSLQAGHVNYRFDAYDENWFYDKQECTAIYDANWAYTSLYELGNKLRIGYRKYIGLISKYDLKLLLRQEAEKYGVYVEAIARAGVKEAVNSPEFAAIAKEELLNIYIGEYKDRCRTIYRHDSRPKDIVVIKQKLQETQRKLPHEVLENLDFSGIDLKNSDLRYGRFTESSLDKSNLTDSLLWGVTFTHTRINSCDFSYSELPGADFRHAQITGSQFESIDGEQCGLDREPYIGNIPGANFENATLSETDFGEAFLTKTTFSRANLSNCNFSSAEMTGTTFQEAVLSNCDFNSAVLKTANFHGAVLKSVNFQNVDLTGADFRGTTFIDCVFDFSDLTGAAFLRNSNVTKLQLTPEQQKNITLVGA